MLEIVFDTVKSANWNQKVYTSICCQKINKTKNNRIIKTKENKHSYMDPKSQSILLHLVFFLTGMQIL